MSNEVAKIAAVPQTLMPYLLSPSEFQATGHGFLPAPVIEMKTYRRTRPVRRTLMPWGPISLVGALGSSSLVALSAVSVATVGSIGPIIMLIGTSLATVATGGIAGLSRKEELTVQAEYNWLLTESEKRLQDWIKSQFGVTPGYIKVKTGELVGFVNEQTVGEIEFGVVNGGHWNIWRDEPQGPLATDYEPPVARRFDPWGTTKKADLDELFDKRGRTSLREALTLLNELTGSEDVETKHRIERARQMLVEVENLAARTTSMTSKTRTATMVELSHTVAAVVADLTEAKNLREEQVEREAKVLSRYASKVANLDQNMKLQLPR